MSEGHSPEDLNNTKRNLTYGRVIIYPCIILYIEYSYMIDYFIDCLIAFHAISFEHNRCYFNVIIIESHTALFLSLSKSTLHSITPARIASLTYLAYCYHARCRSQYPSELGSHFSPEWREAEFRLGSCSMMLSNMKQLAPLWLEPMTLGLRVPHPTK